MLDCPKIRGDERILIGGGFELAGRLRLVTQGWNPFPALGLLVVDIFDARFSFGMRGVRLLAIHKIGIAKLLLVVFAHMD